MADSAPTDDERTGSTRNIHHGRADRAVQARDIHGDVHLGDNRRWLLPVAVLGTALVVAALIIAWPHSDSTGIGASQAPSELRVTADLSHNDQPPWGYVSDSPEFPGPDLVSRLARPYSARDDASIAQDLRRTDAAKLRHQTIRLHLEGPHDRAVRVTDIRPVIRSTRPPLDGSIVLASSQGDEESSEVQLYLDDPFPILQATRVDAEGRHFPAGPYFPSKTINLSGDETHEVVVTTFADSHSYEYELVVVYQSGNEIQQQAVNDGGRPFRVSGLACAGPGTTYRAAYLLREDFSIRADPDPGRVERSC